jgi:hypothetical protein
VRCAASRAVPFRRLQPGTPFSFSSFFFFSFFFNRNRPEDCGTFAAEHILALLLVAGVIID